MTSHVLAFSLFLPGHVAGDDTPSRYSNTMQHCPSCSSKLVLLLDKFGELRHNGHRGGQFASSVERNDQPLSPGPPAYGAPVTCTPPQGCGDKPWGHSPAMCGSHAYLSQLSGSGSLEPTLSLSTDMSECTQSSAAEKRRMIKGGWYCSHCGVHIKPGCDGTSSKPSKLRKSSGDDDDYDAWEAQVQNDFCAFLSAIRESFDARERQLQNCQVELVRREKSLLKKEDLFRERMAKLGRAEDIMQQKVKRLMLYKEAMMAQIKSQVSKARAYEEKVMGKRVAVVTRWTQTDISTAWRYGVSGDMVREPGEEDEWESEGRWPPPEEEPPTERSEVICGAMRRGYGRPDDVPGERVPDRRPVSRGPSRDDTRLTYRGNVESRISPTRPATRRPMSLDRRSQRGSQSGVPRARSASERGESTGGMPGANTSGISRNHRPLRSPNATQVRFERTPQRLGEQEAEEDPFALEESDEVFVGDESSACKDRQTNTPRHRNPTVTTPRMTGNYHPVKEGMRPNYRSVGANNSNDSPRRLVSIGRYNATSPKHNDLTPRHMTSPLATYDFPSADPLMLSTNGEQKTPDSGYLSPQGSRSPPNERYRSQSANSYRTGSAEGQVRASCLPRRTAESANQRSSKHIGYVREKPSLRGPTAYTPRADRPSRPLSALEQSRSTSRLPLAKKVGAEPRPWSSRPRRSSVRSASEPPSDRCSPGGYSVDPSGGSGDVDGYVRPVRLSESFFEAGDDAEYYEDAGRWQSPDGVHSPPSEPAQWTSHECTTQWTSSDCSPAVDDTNERNNDYINSLMQRELDRSCTPAQPKKYFDLAPTYKRWLYDYSRTYSASDATPARPPDAQQRPTKSSSRLPHRIATYRRMAAHSEKAAVH